VSLLAPAILGDLALVDVTGQACGSESPVVGSECDAQGIPNLSQYLPADDSKTAFSTALATLLTSWDSAGGWTPDLLAKVNGPGIRFFLSRKDGHAVTG